MFLMYSQRENFIEILPRVNVTRPMATQARLLKKKECVIYSSFVVCEDGLQLYYSFKVP